jgi:hypothetical protein
LAAGLQGTAAQVSPQANNAADAATATNEHTPQTTEAPCTQIDVRVENMPHKGPEAIITRTNISNHLQAVAAERSGTMRSRSSAVVLTLSDSSGDTIAWTEAGRVMREHQEDSSPRTLSRTPPSPAELVTLAPGTTDERRRNLLEEFILPPAGDIYVTAREQDPCSHTQIRSGRMRFALK